MNQESHDFSEAKSWECQIVDRYNQGIDPRTGDQTRIGRWETARLAQLALLSGQLR